MDSRLNKFADLLVNYSTEVKAGDWVGILGDVTALPALRAIYTHVLEAGGNPTLLISDEWMDRQFVQQANDEQIAWLDPSQTLYYEQADVYIRVLGTANTRAMTNIPASKVQKVRAAKRSWLNTRLQRSARDEFRWVGTLFPTEASAQEANMSLEDYEDFVYKAMFCDKDDPKANWLALGEHQQHKINFLKGKKNVRCVGPNVDLTLSIDGRSFINSHGKRNMPCGEIFTGPVEESVNGWVRFSYPSLVGGGAVSGIGLRFVDGRVAEAKAEQNDELLQAQLNTDAGARYLGEFAIGTNFGITQFTGNILYDEKIGGTIHMAIGMGYPETGSKNTSAVHWDMICDMRDNSEIYIDGELFYKNGEFVV